MKHSAPTDYAVILLGDQDTGGRADVLAAKAAEHNASIAEIHTFDPQQARSNDDLTEIDAVVKAIGRAIATMTPVWIPFPMEDFTREQHLRRISLVLQRHGTNLLLGQHLWPCPTEGGVSEIDVALRHEVWAVDELDHAVLAATAFTILGLDQEIMKSLAAAESKSFSPATCPPGVTVPHQLVETAELIDQIEMAFGPGPGLPHPTAAWPRRYAGLRRYATWLVHDCALSQAAAAKVINAAGHCTPQGRIWQQPSISALIRGRYDRGAAA